MPKPKRAWRATVIVPARNEAKNLPESLPHIKRWRDRHPNAENIRLLVVNDGSSDSTARDAKKMGFEVIHSNPKDASVSMGKTLAVKRGVEHARKRHRSHAVVFLDADLVRPKGSSIDMMLDPVIEGRRDMVVGIQGEGMYDMSTDYSGQRAISMDALRPWMEGHPDWEFTDSWALEAMLNENIMNQDIRQPTGRDPPDFQSRKAFRQSSEEEQVRHRQKVYRTLEKRRKGKKT